MDSTRTGRVASLQALGLFGVTSLVAFLVSCQPADPAREGPRDRGERRDGTQPAEKPGDPYPEECATMREWLLKRSNDGQPIEVLKWGEFRRQGLGVMTIEIRIRYRNKRGELKEKDDSFTWTEGQFTKGPSLLE
jgi:hypothetical protein